MQGKSCVPVIYLLFYIKLRTQNNLLFESIVEIELDCRTVFSRLEAKTLRTYCSNTLSPRLKNMHFVRYLIARSNKVCHLVRAVFEYKKSIVYHCYLTVGIVHHRKRSKTKKHIIYVRYLTVKAAKRCLITDKNHFLPT